MVQELLLYARVTVDKPDKLSNKKFGWLNVKRLKALRYKKRQGGNNNGN
ncbi:hypothetical protein [Ferrovum myxofaciens]|jgi:hypothetical protein|uniref:Uncharacterized protein n=2 Tax=root TaxID=1 RepID=A0A9E6MX39_9PROT|nr:hypothetical protein [Ferrovum myxofaciens]QKE37538.1 MAG: hypothetical protein HO273_01280 [Ferrovum myxofaciens]QWY75187.1 MAG: hypothetical protein JVY19_01705 [Ferrovum myxofaciens]QWY77920.1 MAG: hypothetical protein JZL65_02200 [Ferrovum myxofaciens]